MVKSIIEFNNLCENKIKLKDCSISQELIYLCVNPNYKKFNLIVATPKKLAFKNTIKEFKVLLHELNSGNIPKEKMINFLKLQDFQSFKAYQFILKKVLVAKYRYNTIETTLNIQLPIKLPKITKDFIGVVIDYTNTYYNFVYKLDNRSKQTIEYIVHYIKKTYNINQFALIFYKNDLKLYDFIIKGQENNITHKEKLKNLINLRKL